MQRSLGARFRAQAAVLLVLCAAALLWRYHLIYVQHASDERTFLATDTRFDSILFGCALALGANPMLDAPRLPRALLLYAALPAGLLLLFLAIVVRDPDFRTTLRYTVQAIGLCPVFVAAMRAPDFWAFRWLNQPLVRRLGALSYSLYLVHLVVLFAVEIPISDNKPLRAVISFALSFAIAEVINRYVEKPCARLRRRFAHATWLSSFGRNAEIPPAVTPAARNDLGYR
jgi:peptidoglycan/LPS O-acetylase OafA/YrhL